MRKKLAVMMAAMAATAMVGGCGAKDAAPTGAETKPSETSAAQETEAAQEETKEADAHEAEYLAEFFDVQIKEEEIPPLDEGDYQDVDYKSMLEDTLKDL